MRRVLLAIGVPCVLSLLSACSAMGLGEYELVECASDESVCEALNADLPDSQCERYACADDGLGCELRPADRDRDGHPDPELCEGEPDLAALDCDESDPERSPSTEETCNGKDDNCDGDIDEGLELRLEPEPESIELSGHVEHLSHTRREDGTRYVAITHEGEGGFATTAFAYGSGAPDDALDLFASDARCEDRNELCRFTELSLGASATHTIAAGVHRGGCGAGQLRVGIGSFGDDTEPGSFAAQLEAPATTTNVALGIDVQEPLGCTQSGACPGARDPLVAVLGSQALAVFTADALEDDVCSGEQGAQPLALGLFARGDDPPRLVGISGGSAEPIGERLATGKLALAALGADGYLIGYPADDAIELVLVPRLAEDDSVSEVTRSLVLEASDVRAVALSAGGTNEDGELQGLLLAHATEDHVVLTALRLTAGDVPHIESTGSSVTLAAEGEVIEGPVLEHVASGFIAEDFAGERKQQGGFFVVWIERAGGEQRVMAARIAEAGFRVLEEPFELVRGELSHAWAYVTQGERLGLGYVERDDRVTVKLSELACER